MELNSTTSYVAPNALERGPHPKWDLNLRITGPDQAGRSTMSVHFISDVDEYKDDPGGEVPLPNSFRLQRLVTECEMAWQKFVEKSIEKNISPVELGRTIQELR